MPILADIHNCSGCLSCVDSCHTGALYSRWNDEGHLTYGIKHDLCVECHKCEKKCPAVNDFTYGCNDLSLSTPYAAWANDEVLRSYSTSGGVFAAIASYVLSKGGVVIGASLKDNYVYHKAVTTVAELRDLQGSKYTQSDTTGIYRVAYNHLKEGKLVLFSGLGCQVAGLLNFLPTNKQFPNLITIDLICGGVPSRSLITKYVNNKSDGVERIVSFRNKSKYEFSIIDSKGDLKVVPLSNRPLPLCGFYTEMTNKYICYDCKYIGAHRQSDITIGDYWGDTQYKEQHEKGLSVAVAHSVMGRQILESADICAKVIEWNDFLLHNPRMVYGYNGNASSKRRKDLAYSIEHDTYSDFVIKYANGATIRTPFRFVMKVLRYMIGRIKPNKKIIYVRNILNRNR